MSSFEENLDENTKTISCLEKDNRLITSERDCHNKYN